MLFSILSRGLSLLAVAFLSATLANPAQASSSAAFTLQQLIDGETFSTANGLFFSDFEVQITGDLLGQIDPGDIDVVVIEDGFFLTGPLSAADGEIGDLLLSYRVLTESELDGLIGASLLSLGVASGVGAQVAVDELLLAGDLLWGALSTFDTGALPDDAVFFDEVDFNEPVRELLVRKDILLDSYTEQQSVGGSARISLIEQRFVVLTPEPGTLGLLGLGLAGLAGRRRRRAR